MRIYLAKPTIWARDSFSIAVLKFCDDVFIGSKQRRQIFDAMLNEGECVFAIDVLSHCVSFRLHDRRRDIEQSEGWNRP
jgi:hypothetical protein